MTAKTPIIKPSSVDVDEVNALRARAQELALLCDTIRDLTSTLSRAEVVQRLLKRVLVHLESEVASVLVRGPDDKLRIAHARGLPDEVLASTCISMGEGISGHVAQTGHGLLIEDIESHPRFHRQNHERYYTRSAIVAPITLHGRVLGVINVNNKISQEPHSADDLRLLQTIASQAALAMWNADCYEQTLERAQRDSLTGLANHGRFWHVLEDELERADRYQRPLSLTLLDIDNFKALNDTHGHLVGDQVLSMLANALRDASRGSDTPARHGGEEFAVILPETEREGGAAFADKIRRSIGALSYPRVPAGAVTVSVGVATFPDDGSDARELVEAADVRLYRAKSEGRDRVCASD